MPTLRRLIRYVLITRYYPCRCFIFADAAVLMPRHTPLFMIITLLPIYASMLITRCRLLRRTLSMAIVCRLRCCCRYFRCADYCALLMPFYDDMMLSAAIATFSRYAACCRRCC